MSSVTESIRRQLFALAEEGYKSYTARLVPTVDAGSVIGVRMPHLRQMAKDLHGTTEADVFLTLLPHKYYEENNLHALLISLQRSPERICSLLDEFLPLVDNWATCDAISPKVFSRRPEGLLKRLRGWMNSGDTYTARFAIGMLRSYYMRAGFSPEHPQWVLEVERGDYYVDMMVAWYFSTAMAKRYDDVIGYIENRSLDPWTQSKAIQKALDSSGVSVTHKDYLRTIRTEKFDE